MVQEAIESLREDSKMSFGKNMVITDQDIKKGWSVNNSFSKDAGENVEIAAASAKR